MASEIARKQLRVLAERVARRRLTDTEADRLVRTAERERYATRETLRKSIAETLDTRTIDVESVFASHDDSDRLLDEITNELNRDK